MAENRPSKPPCAYNIFFSKKSMGMRNRKEALQMFGLLRPGLLMNAPLVEKSNTTLKIARMWNEASHDPIVIFELQNKEKR